MNETINKEQRLMYANHLISDIMALENIEETYVSLYAHDKGKSPFSVIFMTDEKEIIQKSLFSLETFSGKNHFILNSQSSVKSIFDISKGSVTDMTGDERRFSRILWFKKLTEAFEFQVGSESFEILKDARLDNLKVVMDFNFSYNIEITFSVYSEHTSAVYCTIIFDKEFNLIKINFSDNKQNQLLSRFERENLVKAFNFLLNFYINKSFYNTINDSLSLENEFNNDTINDYWNLKSMIKI